MTTQWVRRAHIFVRASVTQAAKNKAVEIMPDKQEDRMFDIIRLSTSGNEPAQAFGCNTLLKLAFVQRWKDEFIDLDPDNVRYYLLDPDTIALLATNSGTVVAGGQPWSWEDSLIDIGLIRIEPPEE